MADLQRLLQNALNLADAVNELLPLPGVSQGIIEIGRKTVGILDDLKEEIPLDQQADAQARRKRLAESVEAKAKAESRKLRGE